MTRVRCIDALHAIHQLREKPDPGNISLLAERMCMHHQPSLLPYQLQLLRNRGILNFRMGQEPLFIYPVNQKFRSLITGFVSEEHRKADLVSISFRRIKRRTEPLHPFLPWQRPIHTGIAIPCVIRNKNSCIAIVLRCLYHLLRRVLCTGTGLPRMQMCFI